MSQPWMPFYVADYLGDTGNLSTLEHGAYLLLIMYYWRHQGLPKDDEELSSIARMTEAEWAKSRARLKRLFKSGDWVHTRIEAELHKADIKRERRVEAGKRGGIAKAKAWQTPSKPRSNATANAKQKPDKMGSNALASSSQPQSESVSQGSVQPREAFPAAPVGWPADWVEELQGLVKACPGADQAIALGVGPLLELGKRGFEWAVVADGVKAAAAKCDKISSISPILTFIETSNRDLAKARGIASPVKNGHAPDEEKPEMVRFKDNQEFKLRNVLAQIKRWEQGGEWHTDIFGFPPGSPFCLVPEELWKHLPAELLAKGAAA